MSMHRFCLGERATHLVWAETVLPDDPGLAKNPANRQASEPDNQRPPEVEVSRPIEKCEHAGDEVVKPERLRRAMSTTEQEKRTKVGGTWIARKNIGARPNCSNGLRSHTHPGTVRASAVKPAVALDQSAKKARSGGNFVE